MDTSQAQLENHRGWPDHTMGRSSLVQPAYSMPSPWIDKFIAHGNGICLVQSSRAKWWIRLWNEADACVALPSDLKFITGAGQSKGIFMPVILVAIGAENVEALHRSGLSKVR